MTELKRAFGNCENCPRQRCAIWFVGSKLLCAFCRVGEPEEGQRWTRDKSLRVVKESNGAGYPSSNLEVIYSLYREQRLWQQHKQGTPEEYRVEWWYLREGSCSLKTWQRWALNARLEQTRS